jgi:hypothetical protein
VPLIGRKIPPLDITLSFILCRRSLHPSWIFFPLCSAHRSSSLPAASPCPWPRVFLRLPVVVPWSSLCASLLGALLAPDAALGRHGVLRLQLPCALASCACSPVGALWRARPCRALPSSPYAPISCCSSFRAPSALLPRAPLPLLPWLAVSSSSTDCAAPLRLLRCLSPYLRV